jgi:hypothetical protein
MLVLVYNLYNKDYSNYHYEFFVEKYNIVIKINKSYELENVKYKSKFSSIGKYNYEIYENGEYFLEKTVTQIIDIDDEYIELCNKYIIDNTDELKDKINKLFMTTYFVIRNKEAEKISHLNNSLKDDNKLINFYIKDDKLINTYNKAFLLTDLNIIKGRILCKIADTFADIEDYKNAINFLEEAIYDYGYHNWKYVINYLIKKIYKFKKHIDTNFYMNYIDYSRIELFLKKIYEKNKSEYLLYKIKEFEKLIY